MKKWRLDFRIWHWLHAMVVLGLLGTVFLRKTFLSWRTNSELLMQKLAEINLEVTTEQAKMLAKAIRSPMWEWHIILGYALVALLLWRVVLFFTYSGRQNYLNLKEESIHKLMVKLGYIGIYAILFFMAISGLVIHFYETFGMTKALAHSIKEIHEFVFYAIYIFVPMHIIGLFVAENQDEKGIISDMVNGGKVLDKS
ncbi:MAG: cytochrome b/b6 domain-containing protein [Campylobacterota bacterium]|nr:cytochrome b/b6 domain-containing protein [Campylobacterota bacterium]